jgi:hypothetical protein
VLSGLRLEVAWQSAGDVALSLGVKDIEGAMGGSLSADSQLNHS